MATPQEGQQNIPSFGYDLFREGAEPIDEGPIDDQYILSPGDEVVISTWGQLNMTHNLTVSPEGFIEIPDDGGRISTNGVTLRELRVLVTRALSQIHSSYINAADPGKSTAFVDVKLGKVRKLLIYVVGEVPNPGAYVMSSGTATVVNLLHNAGGVKESGSLREIRIRRADGQTDTVDLYDFLLIGNFDVKKSRLRTGDYVIVPLKRKSASILGEVRRPMNYELISREGVKELVGFSGGFLPDAYLLRSRLKRFEINRGEVYLDLDLDQLYKDQKSNFELADGDTLTVLPNIQVRKSLVEIEGEGIVRPGTYEFKAGMTISDLIEKAAGLREYVYLDRADLVRTEADFSKKLTTFSLRELYKETAPGLYAFSGSVEKNFVLREMDRISIYSAYGMAGMDKYVEIEGEVKEPGKYILAGNMTLADLIFARGGFQDPDFKRTAFLDLAHVIRKVSGTIGQRIIPFNLGKVISGDPAADFPLVDGDVVRVYSNDQMSVKGKIEIGGLVNKPGAYDLSENLTVEDLIVLAGGLRADAYKAEAVIARAERMAGEGEEENRLEATIRVLIEAEYAVLSPEKKTPLKMYDKISVRNLPGWEPMQVVSLRGEVRYPGDYSLESREERISSLIRRAEGLRREALPEGAALRRKRYILDMIPGGAPEAFVVSLNLVEALENPGGEYDLVLKDGDEIYIPSNPGTVEVTGAVKHPLILQHKSGFRLNDYLDLCGGYDDAADKSNIVVYSANNTALRIRRGLFSASNPKIGPGSKINIAFQGEATNLETVDVQGAVVKPAIIQHIKGARLGYYLNLCAGPSRDADLDQIVVYLPDGGLLVKKGETVFNPVIPPGSLISVAARPMSDFLNREVPTPPGSVSRTGGADTRGETVKLNIVEVRGSVVAPSEVPYIRDARLGYYLNACGGLAPNADAERIVIQLADGSLLVKQDDVPFNPIVPQGSIVIVNEKLPAEDR